MCCYNLTLMGKLDYIFDILSIIHQLGLHRQENFSELIIQSFIKAITSQQFLIAVKIFDKYVFVLDENSSQICLTLVDSITKNPQFMEIKINMIDHFLKVMDFETVLNLLKAITFMIQQCYEQKRYNFVFYNTSFLMVGLLVL